jgi:pyruvate,orthophosphate dikinase
MIAAEGILTSRGGVSSHAALVARQMGKVCVCGASGIQIDYQKRTLSAKAPPWLKAITFRSMGPRAKFCLVTTAPSEIVQALSIDRWSKKAYHANAN